MQICAFACASMHSQTYSAAGHVHCARRPWSSRSRMQIKLTRSLDSIMVNCTITRHVYVDWANCLWTTYEHVYGTTFWTGPGWVCMVPRGQEQKNSERHYRHTHFASCRLLLATSMRSCHQCTSVDMSRLHITNVHGTALEIWELLQVTTLAMFLLT